MKNIVKINIYDNSNDNKASESIVCIDIICISFSSYKVRLVLQKECLLNSDFFRSFKNFCTRGL